MVFWHSDPKETWAVLLPRKSNFTTSMALCHAPAAMKKKSWPVGLLLALSLLSAGCTTTITNLTPSTAKRNPTGLYRFEAELDTTERAIRQDTVQPYVLIGPMAYPMQ